MLKGTLLTVNLDSLRGARLENEGDFIVSPYLTGYNKHITFVVTKINKPRKRKIGDPGKNGCTLEEQ